MGDSFYDDDGEYENDDSSAKASEYSKSSKKSDYSKKSLYSPPTIELANSAGDPTSRGCCAQDYGINLGESEMRSFESMDDTREMRSFESMDDDGNYKQLCYVSYSGLQPDTAFETDQGNRCIQAGFASTISEMKSDDSDNLSQLKTRSNSSTYIGIVDTNSYGYGSSEEDESKAGQSERGSQPDIVSMNQSDVSSFESMNDKASRLQKWITHQRQLAQDHSQLPYVHGLHQPQPQTLEKVEEENNLGSALLRVQQRIIENNQKGRESPADESTAASSEMSSIV
jgi:hypothetical protein